MRPIVHLAGASSLSRHGSSWCVIASRMRHNSVGFGVASQLVAERSKVQRSSVRVRRSTSGRSSAGKGAA